MPTAPCGEGRPVTHLAVAIGAPDTETALAQLHRAAGMATLAEVRLDLMQRFDLPRLLADSPLPLIITCRPAREGGRWQGSEVERLALLEQAASLDADYVDLEWDSAAHAGRLRGGKTRVILSRHDWTGLPADLPGLAARLWAAGTDVVKLVGTAHGLADILPVLQLLDRATQPTIALAMGEPGLLTRLLAFRYPQAFLSFAVANQPTNERTNQPTNQPFSQPTAPGQIALDTMASVYRVQAMSRQTILIGLLGADANRSPWLEEGNAWLAERGLDAVLIPLQPASHENALEVLGRLAGALPLAGCLLQPPYDQGWFQATDVVTFGDDDWQGARLGGLHRRLDWLLAGRGPVRP